jgi:NitT/TauT family transport system ATP-binding protein
MSTAGIHVEAVNHRYGSGAKTVHALSDINLDIQEGEFVALLGSSGCGKTTLLDILTGLTDLQTGSTLLDSKSPVAGRKDTARMFARDALLPWRTAAQNIDFALATRVDDAEERAQRIKTLLNAVGLEDFHDAYPAQLSQGMRQRVALARTFSLQSRFVLLDEPFGAVDALTKVTLQDLLVDLWEQTQSTTVVLVTHDIGEAIALADRVVVMSPRPGRIVADVAVDIPRPRRVRALQKSPEYHELIATIWDALEG